MCMGGDRPGSGAAAHRRIGAASGAACGPGAMTEAVTGEFPKITRIIMGLRSTLPLDVCPLGRSVWLDGCARCVDGPMARSLGAVLTICSIMIA